MPEHKVRTDISNIHWLRPSQTLSGLLSKSTWSRSSFRMFSGSVQLLTKLITVQGFTQGQDFPWNQIPNCQRALHWYYTEGTRFPLFILELWSAPIHLLAKASNTLEERHHSTKERL